MNKILNRSDRRSLGRGADAGQGLEGDSGEPRRKSDWQKTTFGEVATGFLSGGTPTTKRSDYWEGEIPWVTSKWLGSKLELTNGEKLVSKEAVEKSSTKIVPKNSIIFATRVGVGKVGINRIDLAINQDLAGVLIDNDDYDIKFLAYQLGIDSIQQYIAMNKRGATIKGITRDCLEQIRLNIPPLPEQKKIAHILSTVQRAIEAQERIIQTTTELKKALMQKLFTEGLRNEPQKQTEIGPVPESWEVVPIGKYARVLNGYAFKSANYVRNGVRLIRISNVSTGLLIDKDDKYLPTSYLKERNAYALKVGDLILSLTRPIIKEGMKYCFIEEKHLPALLNQRVGRFEITNPRLRKDYLFQIIFSPYFITPLKYMAEGSNQPNVSPTRLETFQIPIPTDMVEQERIAKLLTELNRKMELAKQKASQLEDLFRTLLHDLMNAKTRVHKAAIK